MSKVYGAFVVLTHVFSAFVHVPSILSYGVRSFFVNSRGRRVVHGVTTVSSRFGSSADRILVCSGLGARGIDLPDVALVVEYQMAPNIVEHVHRVGRTARAGKAGRAVSLVHEESANEAAIIKEIERCSAGGWKFL